MAHQAFDAQMEALDALKGRALDADGRALVKKCLAHRSNFLVAKAARLAEDNGLTEFVPDLIASFERFFLHGEKTDPQCWAKNALSHALMKLQCTDKDVYLRGLQYHQMEPVWGGRSDSAGTLRANCAHALAVCHRVSNQELVVLLVELLVDTDASVRLEAVRAMAQAGETAVPVLRLHALLAQNTDEPEVLGACFSALIALEREESVPFVARFLQAREEVAGEAAIALVETHSPAALRMLIDRTRQACEPVFHEILLSAIALTRLPEAIDFLLALIEKEEREAPLAIAALVRISPSEQLSTRLQRAVEETGSPRLMKALREHLPAASG